MATNETAGLPIAGMQKPPGGTARRRIPAGRFIAAWGCSTFELIFDFVFTQSAFQKALY